jgi:hypothetical protein
MAAPGKATGGAGTDGTGELVFGDGGAPTGGGTGGGKNVTTQPKNEILSPTNLLPTIGKLPEQLRSVTAETQRAKEETDAFTVAQTAAAKAVQVTDEKISSLITMNEQLSASLKNLIEGVIVDVSVALGEQLGNALSGAKFEISALLAPIADAIVSFGKMAIQAGVTALAIKAALKLGNPLLAIASGIALVAIGTAIKKGVTTPKLAEGGLAYGPTMATVGDNRNARVDPEVIAPLSKLKGMLDGGGSPYILTTRVAGSDLLVIMEKAKNINSRIR